MASFTHLAQATICQSYQIFSCDPFSGKYLGKQNIKDCRRLLYGGARYTQNGDIP